MFERVTRQRRSLPVNALWDASEKFRDALDRYRSERGEPTLDRVRPTLRRARYTIQDSMSERPVASFFSAIAIVSAVAVLARNWSQRRSDRLSRLREGEFREVA